MDSVHKNSLYRTKQFKKNSSGIFLEGNFGDKNAVLPTKTLFFVNYFDANMSSRSTCTIC